MCEGRKAQAGALTKGKRDICSFRVIEEGLQYDCGMRRYFDSTRNGACMHDTMHGRRAKFLLVLSALISLELCYFSPYTYSRLGHVHGAGHRVALSLLSGSGFGRGYLVYTIYYVELLS